MSRHCPHPRVWPCWACGLLVVAGFGSVAPGQDAPPRSPDPLASFRLPEEWQAKFWKAPGVADLVALEPKDLAGRVPVQAGFRHSRCPVCDAPEAGDPLAWAPDKPDVLTCRSCGGTFPNDQIPAKVKDKEKGKDVIPEAVVEVRPGLLHRYPYHIVEPPAQRYPDERVYLNAKRDYECREFLSKLALYAAIRYRDAPGGEKDPRLARTAAVLLLRFAQVYPDYATHFDQPGRPKFLQPAELPPPYRRGYATGKWDWLGCLDVPLNLAIAYAIVRDTPALVEAGQALDDPEPRRTIEDRLFRAAAEFARRQTEEYSEASLYAYRGLLAVGRLLDDGELMHEAVARLEAFARRGFHFDGLWRQGDALAHRRVLAQIDGWIDRLLVGYSDPPGFVPAAGRRFEDLAGAEVVPQIPLARRAGAVALTDAVAREVLLASWPAPAEPPPPRRPALLGGAGLARLAVGQGPDALDLELRGLGDFDAARSNRLALRLAVGGRTVLGDLDDRPPTADGFDRATASHNTVAVDGLNQRENPDLARIPAPGSDVRFYAADPDFQVAVLEDRYAYPTAATRYRRFVVATAGERTRYAVDVFEVVGGRQHDLLFHGAVGTASHWRISTPTVRGPGSLLPPSVVYVPTAPALGGRWFIQAYGAFSELVQGLIDRPGQAVLLGPDRGLRLHLLGSTPATAYLGHEPGETATSPEGGRPGRSRDRAALILRRRATDAEEPLTTLFVTVHEPIAAAIEPLDRVGRVESPPGTVVLLIQSAEGPEHLVLNLDAGSEATVRLADGRELRTDGLAVRVRPTGLVLAGGTYATLGASHVEQTRVAGTIARVYRGASGEALGAFLTADPVPEPGMLAGRVLLIRHGDGTSCGWTIDRVEPAGDSASRIFVREEPGFQVHPETGEAHYYQFPRTRHPGPHHFVVGKLAR